MPRIRRYHPVSHEFNRDPEVRALRKLYGDWMALVWLEILAVADRNEGWVKGDRASTDESLSLVSLSSKRQWTSSQVSAALLWMAGKGWVELHSDAIYVVKYREYHKTRGTKKSRQGTKETPPFLTTERPNSSLPDPVFPDSLKEVPELLKELGIQNGMMDPKYWDKIDKYVEATKLPIYWMDELRKYVMECVETRKAGRRPHKDLKRGFWTWIKRCETWERTNAEKAKFRETRT